MKSDRDRDGAPETAVIVYILLGSTLRAPVLETFEVKVIEGLAQLSCQIFHNGRFLEGVRQEQNGNQLPNHEAHTDRPSIVVLLGNDFKLPPMIPCAMVAGWTSNTSTGQ